MEGNQQTWSLTAGGTPGTGAGCGWAMLSLFHLCTLGGFNAVCVLFNGEGIFYTDVILEDGGSS